MVNNDDDEEEERVTAQSYGALDTSRVADACWCIRIPPKLAAVWDAAEHGTELGILVFRKGASASAAGHNINSSNNGGVIGKPEITVHVSDALIEELQQRDKANSASVTPLHYSLQAMTKKVPLMHPFTRNPRNGSVQLLGTVSRTANCQVQQQDQNYRALLKDRLVTTALQSNRYVKPVEAAESVISKQRTTTSSFANAVYEFGQRNIEQSNLASATAAQPAAKKARQFGPDQPIRSILFELFGQQQYWTVKDLKAAAVAGGATHAGTRKAEGEMRDILREIGEYHRSGDHKNMWELRKEFQR